MPGRGGCLLHMIKSHREPSRFVPALISLDEDPAVRLATRVVDTDPECLDFELPMQVTFRPISFAGVDGSVVAPLFVPT